MPSQTLDYFDHVVLYDCAEATADLERFGIRCPRFVDYAQRLVTYYLKHVGEISGKAMA
jgi:hypothetical protein